MEGIVVPRKTPSALWTWASLPGAPRDSSVLKVQAPSHPIPSSPPLTTLPPDGAQWPAQMTHRPTPGGHFQCPMCFPTSLNSDSPLELHVGKRKQKQVLPPPGFVWLLTLLPAPVQCSHPLFFQFNINGFMLPLIFQINMTQVRENSPVTNQPWERKVFVDGSFLPAKLGASVGICPLVDGCKPACPLWSTHVVGSPRNRAASWQRMSDTGAWLWCIPAYLLFRWRHLGEEHIFIMRSKCQNERKSLMHMNNRGEAQNQHKSLFWQVIFYIFVWYLFSIDNFISIKYRLFLRNEYIWI